MRRLAIAVFGALAFGAAPAHAATFQVNTTVDGTTCNAITCSLRGALGLAQQNPPGELDVINVPAGTYQVQELVLAASQTGITIVGAGANATVIEPSAATRVFQLTSQSGLTLRGLTVRGGRPASEQGGNILARDRATLTLEGVRVTNGQAPSGGGIGSLGSGTITVAHSLIDTNTATGTTGTGGGIFVQAQTFTTPMVITDTTIAFNGAAGGAGIATNSTTALVLRGVTLADNAARSSNSGVGGVQVTSGLTIQGSLIARNTTRFVTGSDTIVVPANCSVSGPLTDQGGTVEDQNQCVAAAGNRVSTDPQLATSLDGSQPPVLTIPATSPAVNFADCGGRTLDQRGVPRPQGALCDAGAYEFNPAPDTSIAGAAPPFTFSATDPGSTFECSLDGAPFTACAPPFDPGAGPGSHTFAVRAVDPQSQADGTPATVTFTVATPATPTPAPSSTPTPTPTATPVVNRTIVVGPARGTVKVKVPGSKRYVELDSTIGIPVGSSVDTRRGRVTLTSIPKAGAPPQTAVFFDGLFRVTQSKGITNLTLTEQLAACPKKGKRASAAAKKKSRKLWGDGKGAFRTSGKYSAATVRGTRWLVQDSCAGTLTRVTQGSVTVRRSSGGPSRIVRAGKRLLVRPSR